MSQGFFSIQQTCRQCGGQGQIRTPCSGCSGSGLVSEMRKVDVKIPAGVDSRTKLRLVNQGDAGEFNGPRGHLWVRVRIRDHPDFRREGQDIHINAPISLATSILGGTVQIPGLNGPQTVRVPPGSQADAVLTLQKQGIPILGRRNDKGNAYVHLKVQIPRTLSPKGKELVEALHAELFDSTLKDSPSLSSNPASMNSGGPNGAPGHGDKAGFFGKVKNWVAGDEDGSGGPSGGGKKQSAGD